MGCSASNSAVEASASNGRPPRNAEENHQEPVNQDLEAVDNMANPTPPNYNYALRPMIGDSYNLLFQLI